MTKVFMWSEDCAEVETVAIETVHSAVPFQVLAHAIKTVARPDTKMVSFHSEHGVTSIHAKFGMGGKCARFYVGENAYEYALLDFKSFLRSKIESAIERCTRSMITIK